MKERIYIFYFSLLSILLTHNVNASGGYDNGTSIGKKNIGLDLTWNPFNYWEKGQSYAVISYGFTQNLDIHFYYSSPVKGSDNYYMGIFYQFIDNKQFDLATSIGTRRYIPRQDQHLFFPQILYTLYIANGFRIGGSFVSIKNISNNYKYIGTTADIALIIPIFNSNEINENNISIDLTIGAFRPALWKPKKGFWHPTYSIDIKLDLNKL
tara:strand:- start:61 stop:690 length:630 start_codon:yes stop_codon:yes gene_type:complete